MNTIHTMQNLCRATMAHLCTRITPGMSLRELRALGEAFMLCHGADSFWYWDIGVFVFRGAQTALSVSGQSYTTADSTIERDDIITIDLSPQKNGIWGDYARTLILENGNLATDIHHIRRDEWRAGLLMEELLHMAMRRFVTPETTFDALFHHINGIITDNGFANLDFLGNLGHFIVQDRSQRIYTERGNLTKLSTVPAFTFEPHIGLPGSGYGFKKENIYCFSRDLLQRL